MVRVGYLGDVAAPGGHLENPPARDQPIAHALRLIHAGQRHEVCAVKVDAHGSISKWLRLRLFSAPVRICKLFSTCNPDTNLPCSG